MNIGGTIRFEGGGLEGAERLEDGGVALTFADEGSCEMHLEFSPENSRKLAEVTLRIIQLRERDINFKESKGDISAKDFTMLLSDQDVTFSVEEPDDRTDDDLPTIHILPGSKPDLYSGIFLGLNVAQAEELQRRLELFLDSMKKHAEACKPKRIGRTASKRA